MDTRWYRFNDKSDGDEKEYAKVMFQVEMLIADDLMSPIFVPEYLCRKVELEDEYYYKGRPVYARGRGCAATWEKKAEEINATAIKSSFIPDYEIPSVSAQIHYSVRDNGVIRKLAAYVILGINTEGKKEVLSITVGDNESSKYWLSVLNELKNRGVKDILIICADGLSGIKEAIAAAFPKTEYQRCIVHQVRNTLKYVPDKDRKAFASDLKTIYHASDEEKARLALNRVTEKWTVKYPNSMKRWYDNWDAITPIFKFSPDVRKVIYTTNAIESLNSTYRKLNRQRSVFPSDIALLKALYLATFEATKKWTMSIRNWGQVYGELSIMYEGRLPE